MGKHLFWPFEDPATLTGTQEEILAGARTIRDQMDQKIRDWLAEQGIAPAKIA